MRGDTGTGRVIRSTHIVGGSAGSRVSANEQRSPHIFPQRKDGAVHTLPLRSVAAGRDGTVGDCGV